ncbi:MAG: LysR family transcriptional regulator [Lautropia sp.]
MELKQLRNFVRIADIGSFSKAAQVVHVAQSALSLQLSALEGELGVALFRRVSRGDVLTDAGERLYAEAQKILRHADGL